VLLGAATVALAGCPQAPTEDTRLEFSPLTEAARAALVTELLDVTGDRAANLVTLAEVDHAADASCPTRTVEGDVVVYTATKCTGAATGVRWDGRLEAENSQRSGRLGSTTYDFSRPEELRFFDWHADRPGLPLVVAGKRRYAPGPGLGETLVDNQVQRAGDTMITLDVHLSCVARGTARACQTLDGSTAAYASDAAGGDFTVDATLRLDDAKLTGLLRLGGIDELVLDTQRRDDAGCMRYHVGSGPFSYCPAEPPGASSSSQFSWRCDDDGAARLGTAVKDAPIFVKAELRRGHAQQQVALAPTGHDELSDRDTFESEPTSITVVDTAEVPCREQMNRVAARIVSVYADGSTRCDRFGEGEEFDAQACF
jgi:hypothetical protein